MTSKPQAAKNNIDESSLLVTELQVKLKRLSNTLAELCALGGRVEIPARQKLPDDLFDLRDQVRFYDAIMAKAEPELKARRALAGYDGTLGGYMLTGDLLERLISTEANKSVIRGMAMTQDPIPGPFDDLLLPVSSGLGGSATWTGEISTVADDASAPFEQRILRPKRLVKRVPVSNKLLRVQALSQNWIITLLGEALGLAEETAFLQGSGLGEAMGVLTSIDVPEVETAHSASVTIAELAEFCMSLPDRYANSATIVTTTDFIKWLAVNLKDGQGLPVIGPAWDGRLWNVPVVYSDGMPAILSGGNLVAGAGAAVIGDWRQGYMIADGDTAQLDVLRELKAATNQTLFQATRWVDGQPIIPGAFTVLRIKA